MHICCMRFTLQLIIVLLVYTSVNAQSSYIPLGSHSMHLLERLEIKSGRLALPHEFNSTTKEYQRHRIANYIDSFSLSGVKLSNRDLFNMAYLQADNFEFTNSESGLSKRHLKEIFKYKPAFYGLKQKDFTLVFNPITNLSFGIESSNNKQVALNSRGIEMRGTIGKSIGFFTSFNDEILKPQSWLYQFYLDNKALPGAGLIKLPENFNADSNTIPQLNYSTATGYIVYQPSNYFDIRFGHGRNFIGNGLRSFYISDFSRDHLFMRVNTRIWKINYTNIFGQLYDWVNTSQRNLPKRHYYATTYANINLTKSFNIGLFQTIAFQRDSGYARGGFDWQYLNPIIFYKPVENGLNSPDKSILGADFKWNFKKHFQWYGQVVISEFRISELLADNGWFGNKWAVQTGFKYIDVFGIQNLDLQIEGNIARPYMYTSFDRLNAFVSYNQNMAHPLGANFYEGLGVIRYQPAKRLFIKLTGIYAIYGNDTPGVNFGKDIRLSYQDVAINNPYGHTIAQGIRTELLIADVIFSYMVKHNVFIDFHVIHRSTTSELEKFNTNTNLYNITLRWNMWERRSDF